MHCSIQASSLSRIASDGQPEPLTRSKCNAKTDGGVYCENQIMVAEEESERRRPKDYKPWEDPNVKPFVEFRYTDEKPIPTLAEWREGWEAESDEGRRQTISWEEAERRYNKMYPSDEPYEPYR